MARVEKRGKSLFPFAGNWPDVKMAGKRIQAML